MTNEAEEPHTPMWVKCKKCLHNWVMAFLPMRLTDLVIVMQNGHCPKCASNSSNITFSQATESKDVGTSLTA